MTTKPDWSLSDYFLDNQHKAETKKRRNRITLLTFFVLVIVVFAVGSLFYTLIRSDFFRSENTAESASVSEASAVTSAEPVTGSMADSSQGTSSLLAGSSIMKAYELALVGAREWKDDAVLLKASATWSQGANRDSLLNGSETWSFSFYSPGSKRTANTSVIDGKAVLISQQSLGSSIQPSAVDGWAMDSNVAILRMLDEGGEKFLNENEIISMTMALTAGVERGRPEWLISVLGSRDGRYYNMRLDASNGEVLDAFASS